MKKAKQAYEWMRVAKFPAWAGLLAIGMTVAFSLAAMRQFSKVNEQRVKDVAATAQFQLDFAEYTLCVQRAQGREDLAGVFSREHDFYREVLDAIAMANGEVTAELETLYESVDRLDHELQEQYGPGSTVECVQPQRPS